MAIQTSIAHRIWSIVGIITLQSTPVRSSEAIALLRVPAPIDRRAISCNELSTKKRTSAWRPTWLNPSASCEGGLRSEEHTSELQSLMRISYAVFCLKKKKRKKTHQISKKKNNIYKI